MRQVNQPDVLPNRSLKIGEIRKSLVGKPFLMRGAACREEMLRSRDSSIVVAQQAR